MAIAVLLNSGSDCDNGKRCSGSDGDSYRSPLWSINSVCKPRILLLAGVYIPVGSQKTTELAKFVQDPEPSARKTMPASIWGGERKTSIQRLSQRELERKCDTVVETKKLKNCDM